MGEIGELSGIATRGLLGRPRFRVKRLAARWLPLLALSLCHDRGAHADDQPSADLSAVKVYVRTIEATGATEAAQEATSPEVDPPLNDLRSKLERLPFHSYRLLAAREEELPLRKKETLSLPNGQSLCFRPVYMENKRVGIWLNWKDREGGAILNTRIHFDTEEWVLTGTDGESGSGLILAIRAYPVAAP